MSTRVHTGTISWISAQVISTTQNLVDFFDDVDFADVPCPALVITDFGNDEAFIIVGGRAQLQEFAAQIVQQVNDHAADEPTVGKVKEVDEFEGDPHELADHLQLEHEPGFAGIGQLAPTYDELAAIHDEMHQSRDDWGHDHGETA